MLLIIGELLNSSRRPVEEALLKGDHGFLVELALEQQRAGCSYLDLNASTLLDREPEVLARVIPVLQDRVSLPISIDSSNPTAMEAGLRVHRGQALLNSIPGKQKEMEEIIPLVGEYRPRVIVSCFDEAGFPETPDRTISIAGKVLNRLFSQTSLGKDDIFLDLLVRPLAVNPESGRLFLESLLLAKKEFPGIKTVAGLSNISYGLPRRRVVNLTFLSNLIGHGLDAVIADPLHPDFQATIIVSEFLNNRPGAREKFLAWARSGQKED